MRKTAGMNRHQKAAHRLGEARVGREQIEELLLLSASDDPDDRLHAAQFLCPCHVRRRIDAVWQALYRMLEDPDPRVRFSAWHTLEDGGSPNDPTLEPIFERALANEKDQKVLRMAQEVAKKRTKVFLAPPVAWKAHQRGQCDFCGEDRRPVDRDLQTIIPSISGQRPALICEPCFRKSPAINTTA